MWQTVVTTPVCFLAIYLPGKYDIISLGSRLFIFRIRTHEELIPFVMIVAAPGTAAP